MANKTTKTKYNNEWNRENCDTVRFNIPKGKKAELQGIADDKGVSLTRLIIEALEEKYGLYLRRPVE